LGTNEGDRAGRDIARGQRVKRGGESKSLAEGGETNQRKRKAREWGRWEGNNRDHAGVRQMRIRIFPSIFSGRVWGGGRRRMQACGHTGFQNTLPRAIFFQWERVPDFNAGTQPERGPGGSSPAKSLPSGAAEVPRGSTTPRSGLHISSKGGAVPSRAGAGASGRGGGPAKGFDPRPVGGCAELQEKPLKKHTAWARKQQFCHDFAKQEKGRMGEQERRRRENKDREQGDRLLAAPEIPSRPT